MFQATVGGVKLSAYPALVLNADFTPLTYAPLSEKTWSEAVKNIWEDTITVIREYDVEVHSPNFAMKLPSVVALRKYAPRQRVPSPSRENILYLRDRFCCAYCGGTFAPDKLTIDHVIPRAHGGKHIWENVVGACGECNQAKADSTPEQAGMRLLWRPWKPTLEELGRAHYFLNKRRIHSSWVEFLPYLEAA